MTAPAQQSLSYRDVSLLCLAYVFGYGWFLLHTDFLPFVFDNNESFSAFIHASNLYQFGFDKSFGLTDEAYGSDPAAHPYVYTHQGNFPRLIAFLMYGLGLRTVEQQVAVSTFTVGLGAIVLSYAFLARLGGRLFGAVAATLFMSDYLLFAQWQVNTFRVWHGFLLFAMLELIERIRAGTRRGPLLLLGLASACVGYFDLLMAVFTFVLCAAYSVGRLIRYDRRTMAATLATMFAGGLASVAVLLLQLIGYYGLEGLRQDLYLTFVGRNYAADDPEAIRGWQQFFVNHNIVFWEALVDSKPVANFPSAVKSVFQYGFSVFTPYLSFVIVGIAGLPLFVRLFDWVTVSWNGPPSAGTVARHVLLAAMVLWIGAACLRYTGALIALPYAILASMAAFPRVRADQRFAKACVYGFWFSAILLASTILLTDVLEGHPERFTVPMAGELGNSTRGLVALAAVCSFVIGSLHWRLLSIRFAAGVAWTPKELLAAGMFCALLALFALTQEFLLQPHFPITGIWDYILEQWTDNGLLKGLALVTSLLLVVLLLAGARSAGARLPAAGSGLPVFFAAVAAGYLAAYFFSPGYMVLINLKRYSPVLVFLLIPLAALAVSQLVHAMLGWKQQAATAALAAIALVHVVFFWALLQKSYFELIPPDGALPFKKMDKVPYANAGFVVDTYGAPVAAKTGTWAYIDESFAALKEYLLDDDGYRPYGQDIYMWFADRHDPKYRRPRYALCYKMPSFFNAARLLEIRAQTGDRSLTPSDIYRPRNDDARLPSANDAEWVACGIAFKTKPRERSDVVQLRSTVVDADPSLLRRWVISKLEEDFPPFLARIAASSNSRVEVRLGSAGKDCVADIRYEYRQQQGKPEHGSEMLAWIVQKSRGPATEVLYVGPAKQSIKVPAAGGALVVAVLPRSATRGGDIFVSSPTPLTGCGSNDRRAAGRLGSAQQ